VSLNLRRAAAVTLAGLATLAAAPAAEAACTPQPASAQPFAQWGDNGLYTLLDGGGAEGDLTGWTLTGSAHVVEGNEPFQAGGADDHLALALVAGDSITTAPICIDDSYPWFRFFARNTSGRKGKLNIEVLYTDAGGKQRSRESDGYATADDQWRPSGTVRIPVDFDRTGSTIAVSFRFTARSNSSFLLDDVFVDPMARG
jgi:hypothetical protein